MFGKQKESIKHDVHGQKLPAVQLPLGQLSEVKRSLFLYFALQSVVVALSSVDRRQAILSLFRCFSCLLRVHEVGGRRQLVQNVVGHVDQMLEFSVALAGT